MKKCSLNIVPLFLALLMATTAQASNFGFLKNSVLTRFSKAETAAFREFVADALTNAKDKDIVQWSSEESALKGRLKIDFSYQTGGTECRRALFIIDDTQHSPERFQFEICKQKGQWQIQDTIIRELNKDDWTLLRETGEQALNIATLATPLSWHNPRSKYAGVITPVKETQQAKRSCRQLAITVFSPQDQASNGTYWLCHSGDGNWQRDTGLD